MTLLSHTLMNDGRCSSSTATPAFSVFLPLNFSGISEGFFFHMSLHSAVIACASLFLLAFVVLFFQTIFSFKLDFLINFQQSGLFFIVGILFAFLLSTFDLPLLPHLVHNVLHGARDLLALLAHLSYSDHNPIFFPPRWISCAICFPLLTGTPYLTSHDAISSRCFRGFFLFASLSLLNASSSSVSAMESSRLKSPWSSAHSFHTLPLGKSLSASFCRLTLLRRLIVAKAWMICHIAFLFMLTASF